MRVNLLSRILSALLGVFVYSLILKMVIAAAHLVVAGPAPRRGDVLCLIVLEQVPLSDDLLGRKSRLPSCFGRVFAELRHRGFVKVALAHRCLAG